MTQLNQIGLKVGNIYTIELKDGNTIDNVFYQGEDLDREGIWVENDEYGQTFIDEVDIKAVHTTFGSITLWQE